MAQRPSMIFTENFSDIWIQYLVYKVNKFRKNISVVHVARLADELGCWGGGEKKRKTRVIMLCLNNWLNINSID